MSTINTGGHCAATHLPHFSLYVITADLNDGQVCPPVFEVGYCWQIVARDGRKTVWRRHAVPVQP